MLYIIRVAEGEGGEKQKYKYTDNGAEKKNSGSFPNV